MSPETQRLVHLIATPVFLGLYLLRLIILMRFRMVKDKSPVRGEIAKGVLDAFLTIVMPWKMESTRKHFLHYLEFIAFHIGLFFTISLAYIYPYVHSIYDSAIIVNIFIVVIAVGLFAGIIRFILRLSIPGLKIISVFDDYLALFMVLLFKISGIIMLLGQIWASWMYFLIVGLLLLYSPFSKIHHYLYYPFARYFYGSRLGRKYIVDG